MSEILSLDIRNYFAILSNQNSLFTTFIERKKNCRNNYSFSFILSKFQISFYFLQKINEKYVYVDIFLIYSRFT